MIARGWIDAATYNASHGTDGGSFLANVEFKINSSLTASGAYGSGTEGFPDFAVATNNTTC